MRFQKNISLANCLEGIESFLDLGKEERDRFLVQVNNIPNVEKVFAKLLKANPGWCELVMKGIKPQFLLEIVRTDKGKPHRKMSLLVFNSGTQPIIKITVIDVSYSGYRR